MDPYVFLATRPCLFMGQALQVGDRVAILPGRYVSILRDLPPDFGLAYGAIMGADRAGGLEYLTPHRRLSDLAQAVGQEPPVPGSWRSARPSLGPLARPRLVP